MITLNNATLIKGIQDIICGPLSFLINRSFESEIFPENLKIAQVIPTYSGREKHLLCNYRPISRITCFSKIVQAVIELTTSILQLYQNARVQ